MGSSSLTYLFGGKGYQMRISLGKMSHSISFLLSKYEDKVILQGESIVTYEDVLQQSVSGEISVLKDTTRGNNRTLRGDQENQIS